VYPGSDPNYNSLYTVNEATGALPVWVQLAPRNFFMDLAFDREGRCSVSRAPSNPSSVPAILYRIDPETGAATTIVHLVGSNSVMGLVFGRKGQLYAAISLQTRVSIESTSKQVLRQPSPLCLLAFQAASSWRTHRSHSNDPRSFHRHGPRARASDRVAHSRRHAL